MALTYETQDIRAATTMGGDDEMFVWTCHKCGRLIGRIRRVDGELVIRHKCGAVNRLDGVLVRDEEPVS